MRTLTAEQARAFYDRFGTRQDRQTFYESAALDLLVEHAGIAEAQLVFEFGCGTGRFAVELLRRHLPSTARYLGIDISTTMVRTASERLAAFAPRASAALAAPDPAFPLEDGSADRVVSTYVLDLLPEPAVQQVLSESGRVLRPGGLLCLAGITRGTTVFSRVVMSVWQWAFSVNPAWVGGCRPTSLASLLTASRWTVRFRQVVVAWGVASEVVIASPPGTAGTEDVGDTGHRAVRGRG
jgi:ubiquinone/menaquinone biosynthesis C-methylase UbiE